MSSAAATAFSHQLEKSEKKNCSEMSQMIRIIETPVEVLDLLHSPFKYADSANLLHKANQGVF